MSEWLSVQYVQADMPRAVLEALQRAQAQAGRRLPLVVVSTGRGDVVVIDRCNFEEWYGQIKQQQQPSRGCGLHALPERKED